ncbi:MAG: iron ABC transporter substrate-binding protein [Alphaproteobacteria bacterium]|nr:MAG: iron ABC transporter substrate-binding protein [Alphaproteobacteria bacterium]
MRRFAARFASCGRRFVLPVLGAGVLLAVSALETASARIVVDSAGRRIEIPDRIERIVAAGPPASVLVYVLAPEKLVGWNRKPSPAEAAFLAPAAARLPEIGRITGRGGTANLEVILAAKPDLIVDFASIANTYVSLADRVQEQTGIPYILIDGRFDNTVAAIRMFGDIAGVRERAEQIAAYAENVLREAAHAAQAVPPDKRPRVYLARRPNGLETGGRGSINTEIIERAGGINVADAALGEGGLYDASLEQLLAWNPDTIITVDRKFFETVRTLPGWSQIEAVRRNRVFLSPALPYGWIDFPPLVNRFIGLEWLSGLFFPQDRQSDLAETAAGFYRLFYQVEIDAAAREPLLGPLR